MHTSARFSSLTSRTRTAMLLAGGLVLSLGVTQARAQPPRPAATSEVRGVVDRMTTAPRGEIDGAVLDDGTWLHWPPHMQERFTSVVKVGDRVRAAGRTETGPAGDTHFEVQTVTNPRLNVRIDNPDFADAPPPGRPGPGRGLPPAPDRRPPAPGRGAGGPARNAAADAETREVRGVVDRMTTAPRGEIDGAVLDDGTWLHWPPPMQDRFTAVVKAGDRIRAVGRTETDPAGDSHFELQSVTSIRTNERAENPDFLGALPASPDEVRQAPAETRDREQRLRDLQEQLDRLQREIERLRREK